MRIAHVSATFPPYRGGAGTVCLNNALELARRGHDVHVFTTTTARGIGEERFSRISLHRLKSVMAVGNAPLQPQLLLRLKGFDLVHLHCPFIFGAELTAIAARLHRTPLVVTYHNDFVPSGWWRNIVFAVATLTSRYLVLERANRVLFVSREHAASSAHRALLERSRRRPETGTLPNGVDADRFVPAADVQVARQHASLNPSVPVVGFVSTLDDAHHYKGLAVLLDAVRVSESRFDVLVVGGGPLAPRYVALAAEAGLEGRIHLVGPADHDSLPNLYAACDVVAVPSIVPEAFPVVALEALSCAVPVVASDSPGVRVIVKHEETGLLVPAGDAEALARAIDRLLGDHRLRRSLGDSGRRHVIANYSWTRIGAMLERIYFDVLGVPAQ
jgi:glycosyltransferase involved in cell wall biosynthesis